MRPKRTETISDIGARQLREQASRAKLLAGAQLTMADLEDLEPQEVAAAARQGQLAGEGIGKAARGTR